MSYWVQHLDLDTTKDRAINGLGRGQISVVVRYWWYESKCTHFHSNISTTLRCSAFRAETIVLCLYSL